MSYDEASSCSELKIIHVQSLASDSVGLCTYLIPAVGPVRGVDEQGDDLGLGQQGSSSPRGLL